jgi:hypothetical protein
MCLHLTNFVKRCADRWSAPSDQADLLGDIMATGAILSLQSDHALTSEIGCPDDTVWQSVCSCVRTNTCFIVYQYNPCPPAAFRSWSSQAKWLHQSRQTRDVAMFKWLKAARHWEGRCVRRLFSKWTGIRKLALDVALTECVQRLLSSAFGAWRAICTRMQHCEQIAAKHHGLVFQRRQLLLWRSRATTDRAHRMREEQRAFVASKRLYSTAWKGWTMMVLNRRERLSCAARHAKEVTLRLAWQHWRALVLQLYCLREQHQCLSHSMSTNRLRWIVACWTDCYQRKKYMTAHIQCALSQWQGKALHGAFSRWRLAAMQAMCGRQAGAKLSGYVSRSLKLRAFQTWALWAQDQAGKRIKLKQVCTAA